MVLASAIAELPGLTLLPRDEAIRLIAATGVEPGHDDGWEGISPFVTPSVLWSLYAFLRSPTDYWEAICTAIAVGGDVDTTAAMTGAIAGAAVGLEGLPPEIARQVHDRGQWGYEELQVLAQDLHALRMARPSQVSG